jgi:hypothetical protein
MILVELGVNSSIEEYATPSSGVCWMPRKPASISRHQFLLTQRTKRAVQVHNHPSVSAILLLSR